MSQVIARSIADEQESLEADLKDEILRMYEEVAESADGDFHFYHGREAAERFGYDSEVLDAIPASASAQRVAAASSPTRPKKVAARASHGMTSCRS